MINQNEMGDAIFHSKKNNGNIFVLCSILLLLIMVIFMFMHYNHNDVQRTKLFMYFIKNPIYNGGCILVEVSLYR